jgi:hypothetical protein
MKTGKIQKIQFSSVQIHVVVKRAKAFIGYGAKLD